MFTPARTQAPVIIQYEDTEMSARITKHQRYETVWNMVIPYGDYLQNDCLVMLSATAGTQNKDNVWLTVYRNGQGHFMPVMTSSGDCAFWRVRKDISSLHSGKRPEIIEGDTIRLVWKFSDQTAGFRDFLNDTFGRRTYHKPYNVEKRIIPQAAIS